jgi:hypothetical protein
MAAVKDSSGKMAARSAGLALSLVAAAVTPRARERCLQSFVWARSVKVDLALLGVQHLSESYSTVQYICGKINMYPLRTNMQWSDLRGFVVLCVLTRGCD